MRVISAKDSYHLAVVALLVIAGWLPSSGARERLARTLGRAAYVTSRSKRRLVEGNVERVFGNDAERRRIVRATFEDFWREMLAWTAPPPGERVQIIGREHLERALEDGRGAILWESSGFGRRVLAKQLLHAAGFAVHQVHGRNNLGGFLVDEVSKTWVRTALVKRFFDDRERRLTAEIIDLPDSESLAFTRSLRERLARNAILCISGDGREGQRLVPLSFLGRTTLFSPGMVSLSKLSGAPLLPIFCTGTARLVIEAPVRLDDEGERDRVLRRALEHYAALLETYIRRHPDLYRNWHLLGEFLDDREAV